MINEKNLGDDMIYYYSIHKKLMNETIIHKSRFITYLFPIQNAEQAEAYIEEIRKEHPKANHHCYAYVMASAQDVDIQKASDDGEPSGTAGVPMLETIKKNDLSHILAIVVRYFGGIKLGTGGLIRAYGSAVSEAIKMADIIAHADQSKFHLHIDYRQNDSFQNYITHKADVSVLEIVYTERVTYTLACNPESFEDISKACTDFLHGQLSIEPLGEFMIDIPVSLEDKTP